MKDTNYYPFGLVMAGISTKAPEKLENKFKFNGYEQQSREFSDGTGLEWYDYKNRFYDNQVGRFFCVDRLASDYPYYTPYQFAGNEVPNAIDLDGLEPYRVDHNGGIYQAGDNLQSKVDPADFMYFPQGSSASAASTGELFSTALDFVPVVGQIKAAVEGVAGIDLAGNTLSVKDRVLNLVPGRKVGKAADVASRVVKTGDKSADLIKAEKRAEKLNKIDRTGKDFTKAGKEVVKDINKAKNGGKTKCQNCGTETQPAKKHKKGQTPPKNETQVDHIKRKREGGRGNPDNGQVLCRGCNLKKN